MTNMTYAMALDTAINAVGEGEVAEKLKALKAQLAKRSSTKTPTKTQKANEGVMETILNVLADAEEPLTVTEMIATDALNAYTNQKISALLKKLVDGGKVHKEIIGKKAKFSLA